MVGLAIAETSYPCLDSPADEAKSLRDSALWFPGIPGSNLHLNETCFTGVDTPASEFRPLCYTLFGGSGVTDFKSLTKVSVLSQGSFVMVIDFHYDTGNTRRLGHQRHQLSAYDTSYFLIDGAQEEVIESIEVDLDTSLADHEYVENFWKHGRLRSFKVSGHFLRPIYIESSDHTLISDPELGSHRSLPIEDDRNVCEASRTRQSSFTR